MKSLSPAMKRRVDILKRFQRSAECFRQLQERDFPTAWESDEEVYFIVSPEPKVKSLTTKLIRFFPNLSIEDLFSTATTLTGVWPDVCRSYVLLNQSSV